MKKLITKYRYLFPLLLFLFNAVLSVSASFTIAKYTKTVDVDNITLEFDRPTYTVTYADGLTGEDVFEDQVYPDPTAGTTAPVFDGGPERERDVSVGWSPEVGPTVTEGATYTDQCKKDEPSAQECITVNIVFAGISLEDIPADFSFTWLAVNAAQSEYSMGKLLDCGSMESFDTTTLTVKWMTPHYAGTGGSAITVVGSGCDIDGYAYTMDTTEGTADNNACTIELAYDTDVTSQTLNITLTYTPE